MKGVRNRMRLKFILSGSGKTLNDSRLMAFDDRSVSDGLVPHRRIGLSRRETARFLTEEKIAFNTSGAKVCKLIVYIIIIKDI